MLYRKDYNKPNRCPGWAYSGFNWTYPWEPLTDCPGGSSGYYADDCNPWRVHQCPECGVKTAPYVTRFVDPDYVYLGLGSLWRDAKYRWPDVKDYLRGLRMDAKGRATGALRRPMTLYHVTPTSNLSSIFDHGLTPTVGPRTDEWMKDAEPGVFFFESPGDIRERVGKWSRHIDFAEDTELSVLEVFVPGDAFVQPLSLRPDAWDYWTDEVVPPHHIELVKRLPPIRVRE